MLDFQFCLDLFPFSQSRVPVPTGPWTILEPRDQEIHEFDAFQKRRATDFEALKLTKGRSGFASIRT